MAGILGDVFRGAARRGMRNHSMLAICRQRVAFVTIRLMLLTSRAGPIQWLNIWPETFADKSGMSWVILRLSATATGTLAPKFPNIHFTLVTGASADGSDRKCMHVSNFLYILLQLCNSYSYFIGEDPWPDLTTCGLNRCVVSMRGITLKRHQPF